MGIPGLSLKVQSELHLNPFENSLLLLYESDGFLLLYKHLAAGKFQWPRTAEEVRDLSADQYHMLMTGYSIGPSIEKRDSFLL